MLVDVNYIPNEKRTNITGARVRGIRVLIATTLIASVLSRKWNALIRFERRDRVCRGNRKLVDKYLATRSNPLSLSPNRLCRTRTYREMPCTMPREMKRSICRLYSHLSLSLSISPSVFVSLSLSLSRVIERMKTDARC